MDTKKIAGLLMSGIKENLIICGYLFQNMEQEEINEVFKEIYLEIDSIFKHSDDIADFYKKVDSEHFVVRWSSQCILYSNRMLVIKAKHKTNGTEYQFTPTQWYAEQQTGNYNYLGTIHERGVPYKINFYSNPSKEPLVSFLTNL